MRKHALLWIMLIAFCFIGLPIVNGRDEIVFVTAGVILLSLLVQGPLLPAIVRWARMPDDGTAEDEYELAQRGPVKVIHKGVKP